MLTYFIRPIVRFALWLFFRELEIKGEDYVPLDRPVIFVSNHPNVLLDVLLLGRLAPGATPRFLGKSTLFKNPFYAWFLGSLGTISVARSKDRGSQMSSNRAMLKAASDALNEGHSLALFPEGLSHSEPRVRKLKSGTAHIALRTGLAPDGRKDICIVPVGLTYSDPGTFRSDVVLHFGKPIEVCDFLDTYREHRSEGEKQLTICIQDRLIELTRHIENGDLEAVVKHLSSIYTESLVADLPDTDAFSKELRAQQEMIRAVQHFSDTDPDVAQTFSRRLRSHHEKLSRFRLDPTALQGSGRKPLKILLGLVFALPAGFGYLFNAVPYLLPRIFARSYRHESEMVATIKLATGAVFFPLYYSLLFATVIYLADLYAALIFLGLLPLSGFFTLYYYERIWQPIRIIRKFTPRARTFLEGLSRERVELLEDLDLLKSRYIEETQND